MNAWLGAVMMAGFAYGAYNAHGWLARVAWLIGIWIAMGVANSDGSGRHVPLTWGIVSLTLVYWILDRGFDGWWVPWAGVALVVFGTGSLRTALFATPKELHELATTAEVSPETERALQDRFDVSRWN